MFSKLRLPFRKMGLTVERDVDFLFNIASLESACERLGIEFYQMSEVPQQDFILAVLFEGYLTACRYKYKKPKYNFAHAVYWMEYMNRTEMAAFTKYMQDLMGKISEKKK